MDNSHATKNKMYKPFGNSEDDYPKYLQFLKKILFEDKSFLAVIVFFSIAVSILSIAVPISVQYLISSVSQTSIFKPVLVLGTILAILLSFFSIISAMQFFVTELFRQRFMARMVAQITLRLVYSEYKATEKSNLPELANRFFEISSLQKSAPKFFIKTISFFMQSIVGLTLVAFYHPFLLIFSMIISALFYIIHKLYFKAGCITAFFVSRCKYDIAGWLEDISKNTPMFKSETGRDYAKYKTDILSAQYIDARKKHFKNIFSQVVLLLVLYIAASSALLVLGGWLVLQEQLTIGQLVASELILSAILYGIARFGHDLENIYDIISSCEKLTHFFNIPLDQNRVGKKLTSKIESICLKDARYKYENESFTFNLHFKTNEKYLISSKSLVEEKILIKMMNFYLTPDSGCVEYNNQNINKLDLYNLRSKIALVNNSPFIEGSIYEYITFNNNTISQEDVHYIANEIGFKDVMKRYGYNYDMRIIPSGWPFLESEKILLKLMRILVHKPEVIILTETVDILSLESRKLVLKFISQLENVTTIYFSNQHRHGIEFDQHLFLENKSAESFTNIADFIKYKQKFDAK